MILPIVLALACVQGPSPAQLVKQLEARVAKLPDAANYRALADAYVATAQFDRASAAFYKAASLFAKQGDSALARSLRNSGERYETKIDLFYERPATADSIAANYTGAPLEPKSGCYLGAFIDREDAVDTGFIGNGQSHKDPAGFNEATHKHHAVYFTYLTYGRPFPSRWASVLKERGAAAHIAWEPQMMSSVRDDRYLRGFADDCAQSGIPIFLRFAGDMNADWTPYHQDPERYKAMFRLVAKVMHQRAPNVAMVWCPSETPEDRITNYYPGPDAVDWVGVDFYSVLFNDGDPNRDAEWRNPADAIRYVYNAYSKVHPIMVGEWAATHLSIVDRQERSDFAQLKIGQFYSAIPRLFPRLKAVNWLSVNTIEHALPGRQLNDFSLLSDPAIAKKYSEMVAAPYFLESVDLKEPAVAPVEYVRLESGAELSGPTQLSAAVKSYDPKLSVVWNVNGEPSSPKTEPGTYDVFVDLARLHSDSATIAVVVQDQKGRVAGKKEIKIRIRR